MKIRIKNIFVNKKTKEEKEGKVEDTEKVNESENEKKKVDLKIVYDSGINSEDNQNIKEETLKRRKGYSVSKNEKNNNFKLYYNNLVKNKNKISKYYYMLFLGMIVLGTLSVNFAYKTYKLYKKEDYETFASNDKTQESDSVSVFSNSDEGTEVSKKENVVNDEKNNLQDVNTSNIDTKTEVEERSSAKKEAKANTSEKKVNNTSVEKKQTVKPLSFSKPVDGEIIKIFSNDKVIYSKTLELWKTHDGIDIKKEEGAYVKAAERGTVEKVYEDSFFGMTIVIDHGQGYKSSYSNLAKDTLVKVKQSVTKGQKIAKIGKTAIGEIKDESHLHFMLFKDNVSIDPTSVFK